MSARTSPSRMIRLPVLARVLLVLMAMAAAWPLVQVSRDWMEMARFQADAPGTTVSTGTRSSDWIVWSDVDGAITATYVFPTGPGYEAGIRAGDVLFLWDNQQYFDAEDLKNAIAFLPPGKERTYLVTRGAEYEEATVELARHPTFLYPRSEALWRFSLWGFTIGAFFHALGLFIAGPLAQHNRSARVELILIAVSSLWIVGNLIRLLAIELFGPPGMDTTYDTAFQITTFFGLIGWVGFPLLLVTKVASDADLLKGHRPWLMPVLYAVPTVLAIGMFTTALRGSIGPVSIEDLLFPVLFYASCYIGIAAAVSFVSAPSSDDEPGDGPTGSQGWGRLGSAIIFTIAVAAGLGVQGVIPVLSTWSEQATGWLIVSAQLLAVVPVTVYTIGTLRYGKVDEILSRAFVYTLVLGLIFFAFVGGVTALDAVFERAGRSRIVLEGAFVVLLLVLFERVARRLRFYVASFFSAERQKGRVAVSRFIDGITEYLDAESLAAEAISVSGRAFGARSAVVYVSSPSHPEEWVVGNFNPEPPYITEQVFRSIWPYFRSNDAIWARNPELNTHSLPMAIQRMLLEHNTGLAVPIRGDGKAAGLMLFGFKAKNNAVYNLEDLERLRSLASQVGLALERLQLVEREKRLASESSEAHLVALRAQINPHFLFNALNTIVSLIEERPDDAEDVVENLASIFRYTLHTGSKPFVPVSDEMTLVDRYLLIEKARFGERLEVSCTMDDSIAVHPVPAFAVQTLVENAIKHGIEKVRGQARLTITVAPLPDSDSEPHGSVQVTVHDSGVGIPSLFAEKEPATGRLAFFGIGLSNVYERMRELYGRDDLLRFESSDVTGSTVRLVIPPSR